MRRFVPLLVLSALMAPAPVAALDRVDPATPGTCEEAAAAAGEETMSRSGIPGAILPASEYVDRERSIVHGVLAGPVDLVGRNTDATPADASAPDHSPDTLCDERANPSRITAGTRNDTLAAGADPIDWFALRGYCGETLRLSVSSFAAGGLDLGRRLDTVLALERESPLGPKRVADEGGPGAPETLAARLDASEEWRVRVATGRPPTPGGDDLGAGAYVLLVDPRTPPPDAGLGFDVPVDVAASPAALEEGCLVGELPTGDAGDAYAFRFTGGAGPDLHLSFLPGRERSLAVRVTDPAGATTTIEVFEGGEKLSFDGAANGAWTVLLEPGSRRPERTDDPRTHLYGFACRPMCVRIEG